VNVRYDTAKKLAHLVEYLWILDRFSQSLHHLKAHYVQMMDLYLIFQFFKGHCHGSQIMLRKCYQLRRLIDTTCIRCTSARKRIAIIYHGLAVCINSEDDGATSFKN